MYSISSTVRSQLSDMLFLVFPAAARFLCRVCRAMQCPSLTPHGSCSNTQPPPSRHGLRSCWHERDDLTDADPPPHFFPPTQTCTVYTYEVIYTHTHKDPILWMPISCDWTLWGLSLKRPLLSRFGWIFKSVYWWMNFFFFSTNPFVTAGLNGLLSPCP